MDEKELKPNIDFLIPEAIYLQMEFACKRAPKFSFASLINHWYTFEINKAKQEAEKELQRLKASQRLKVPGIATVESLSKTQDKKIEILKQHLDELAVLHPDLMQNKELLEEYLLAYTNNIADNSLQCEYFTHEKHLYIFDSYVKKIEMEGLSLSFIKVAPHILKEAIEELFNPNNLIVESEKLEGDFHKYRFLEFFSNLHNRQAINISI